MRVFASGVTDRIRLGEHIRTIILHIFNVLYSLGQILNFGIAGFKAAGFFVETAGFATILSKI